MGFMDELKKLTHPYAEDEDLFQEEESFKASKPARSTQFDPLDDIPAPAERRRSSGSSNPVPRYPPTERWDPPSPAPRWEGWWWHFPREQASRNRSWDSS